MTAYDFDRVIERRGSGAIKADKLQDFFGREDIIPAWVADMDFATPDFIIDALRSRLEHPILGYTAEPADYRPAIIDWQRNLHGWEIKPEWISYIPGIVKGIGMVINVMTKPGDKVIIMPPVYHPFRITPEMNGREVVNVPLIEDDEHRYYIDYDGLEKVAGDCRLLIFSNPHNPAGRVWAPEELQRLADICHKKGLTVISDEIHADMALFGHRHTPFASISSEAEEISITFGAPTKTFNIPGIVTSFSVVPNDVLREKFYGWLAANEFGDAPLFSHIAAIAAYRSGAEWRRRMLDYIESNVVFVENYLKDNLPAVHARRPEASFLMWLDFRSLGLTQEKLVDILINEAHVGLNDGSMFGMEGEGFMRLNLASPRSVIAEVVERIVIAIKNLLSYESD